MRGRLLRATVAGGLLVGGPLAGGMVVVAPSAHADAVEGCSTANPVQAGSSLSQCSWVANQAGGAYVATAAAWFVRDYATGVYLASCGIVATVCDKPAGSLTLGLSRRYEVGVIGPGQASAGDVGAT